MRTRIKVILYNIYELYNSRLNCFFVSITLDFVDELKNNLNKTYQHNTKDVICRRIFCVWKSALAATEQIALSRISQAENYKNNIYEEAKACRTQKEIQLKKVSF